MQMDAPIIINQLERNLEVFQGLLQGQNAESYQWKPSPTSWCLLEVVCHLLDEEREDFRARTKLALANGENEFIPIDPVGWVTERAYLEQNYPAVRNAFLEERRQSVAWLRSLQDPHWQNTLNHPDLGALSAAHFLANWLAHDHMHIRQILRIQHAYLAHTTGQDLSYAGPW